MNINTNNYIIQRKKLKCKFKRQSLNLSHHEVLGKLLSQKITEREKKLVGQVYVKTDKVIFEGTHKGEKIKKSWSMNKYGIVGALNEAAALQLRVSV